MLENKLAVNVSKRVISWKGSAMLRCCVTSMKVSADVLQLSNDLFKELSSEL